MSVFRKLSLVVLYSTYTVISIFSFFIQPTYTSAEDLLEKAFFPARQQETVINMGNTKRAVGNEILREGVTVNISLTDGVNAALGRTDIGDAIDVTQRAPRIVRFSKFLLRATMVLAVIMIIINGIRYILALGDEGSASKIRDAIKNISIGILVALFSLAIVNLINSITLSTITEDPKPSESAPTTTSLPRSG